MPAQGLLTSVCLLLAFFLDSFRPVFLRSLQGGSEGSSGPPRSGQQWGPRLASQPTLASHVPTQADRPTAWCALWWPS